MLKKLLVPTALLMSVILVVAIPWLYTKQVGSESAYRAPECKQNSPEEYVARRSLPRQPGATQDDARAAGSQTEEAEQDVRAIHVACEANAIARGNLVGSSITTVTTSVSLAIAVVAAIVAALQIGGTPGSRRDPNEEGISFGLCHNDGSWSWRVRNPGTRRLVLEGLDAFLVPPGTDPVTLLAPATGYDEDIIEPGRSLEFRRAVPLGTGDLCIATRFRRADGAGGVAWAKFVQMVAPGGYSKKEQHVTYD